MEINSEIVEKKIAKFFPDLAQDPELVKLIIMDGRFFELEKGDSIMETGKNINFIPLVVHGSLKVFKETDDGDLLYLYHIQKGNLCVASIHCLGTHIQSKIRAQAVETTEIFAIPATLMPKLMKDHPFWFQFVINSWQSKFEELLETIDNIAFKQLDERLIDYLKKHQAVSNMSKIQVTHAQIASELGSKREVISRLLKKLEKDGLVELGRNKIKIINL